MSSENVTTGVNTTTLVINGSGVGETIQLGTGTFTVGAFTPVTYSNAANVTVNGQAGNDTINLNSVNLGGGTLTLTAEAVTGNAGTALTANTLILDNVGQFGALATPINTSIDNLRLVNAGPVYINEFSGLTLFTTGTVTNLGTFVVAGTTNINAGGGSLTLTNAANDFDIVNATDAASINLRDANSINGGLMTAANITLNTVTGVGIQTETANLTVTNSTSGAVNVVNNQSLLVSITNQGDIGLTNTGNVVVERLYSNGNSTAANTGDVILRTLGGGTTSASGSHSAIAAPDIVARNLTVFAQGNFGVATPGRNMSIRVSDTFTFIPSFGARGYVHYFGGRPNFIIGTDSLVVFSGLAELSNQLLIDVESLDEFDPAIFTAVRNYYYEDVAIMMPSDQRLDGSDESEEKEKKEGKSESSNGDGKG